VSNIFEEIKEIFQKIFLEFLMRTDTFDGIFVYRKLSFIVSSFGKFKK